LCLRPERRDQTVQEKKHSQCAPKTHPVPVFFSFTLFWAKEFSLKWRIFPHPGFCEGRSRRKSAPAGMIVPEATLGFAGFLKVKCSAQVIYCKPVKGTGPVRVGDPGHGHPGLQQSDPYLDKRMDPHAYVSTEVDMDALWEFFFETGFLYPKKYRLIQPQRPSSRKPTRSCTRTIQKLHGTLPTRETGAFSAHLHGPCL